MELFSIGFAICLLSGIGCFWLFFKCIDWFASRTFSGARDGSSQDSALHPLDETFEKI